MLLFDEHDRVLLFRGIDSTEPAASPWWFTPGGGLEPDETPREAALREVREETGASLESVAGPVFEHEMEFTFEGKPLRQFEQFFVARVREFAIDPRGWTELESRTMLESRWWTLAELESATERIFPDNLIDLVRAQLDN